MTKAAIQIPSLSDKDKVNFFTKISNIPTTDGCLEWVGSKRGEYGSFGIRQRMFSAHRIAYFLATGTDPGELYVCHSCDNPPCCNPEHLWIGTAYDNTMDKERKMRGNHACGDRSGARLHPERLSRGESCHKAKLSTSDILKIRADARLQVVIAGDFGVYQSVISRIKSRKAWPHIA